MGPLPLPALIEWSRPSCLSYHSGAPRTPAAAAWAMRFQSGWKAISGCPQPVARQPRPFDQAAELRPGHLGMDFVADPRGSEPAIGAGDDPFAPNHAGEAGNALRHQLRMLHQVHAVRHHAGHEELVVGELHLFPQLPLMLV